MGTIKSFEELEIWVTAREIACQVYSLSKKKVLERDFAFKNQICRAAISIMSNIAEGHESQTESVFIRLLGVAKGSTGEVISQLYVALDQHYITKAESESLSELCKGVSCKTASLIKYLKRSRKPM